MSTYSLSLLLIRVLPALLLSFWLVWKLRDFIRTLIVKLMPIRYRISEKSFDLQTRYSLLLSFLLVVGGTLLLSWAIGKAIPYLQLPVAEQTEQQKVFSLPEPRPELIQETRSRAPDTFQQVKEEQQVIPMTAPSTISEPELYETIPAFYLQLGAFRESRRAWRLRTWLEDRLPVPVWVGTSDGDTAPYKVLAGPFEKRAEVIRFRLQNQLDGFPRPAQSVHVYTR